MSKENKDKADAAEARSQQTKGFMQQVRVAARRKYTPEEKVRIVLEGFRREVAVNELCRREGIKPGACYSWTKDFMEAGKERLTRDAVRDATRQEIEQIKGLNVLGLASGGGEQGPILAAAGARVTVLDNSPKQLGQDRFVADRDSLSITTVQGDMADLSMFPDGSFGLIVHPVSNTFVQDVIPVWKESFRVLSSGGVLLAGFDNPLVHLFDYELAEKSNVLQVKYKLPYSDLESRTEAEKQYLFAKGEPIEFGHTLEDQIGGQVDVGFILTGLYEDHNPPEDHDLLNKYTDTYIATRSVKP